MLNWTRFFVLFNMLFVVNTLFAATCADGYEQIKSALSSTFLPIDYRYASLCSAGGYSVKNIPDDMIDIVYDASLIGDEITLCSGGYLSNGACVSYTRGDCPENYVDLSLPDNNIFSRLNNATCSGVYKKFNIQECKESPTDTMCGILCSNNLEYTELGTCAALCPGEYHTLNTSTGLSFPLYATKQITPSINIQMGENVCYVNLLSGESTNAINIEYNNKIYHTIK